MTSKVNGQLMNLLIFIFYEKIDTNPFDMHVF